MIPAGRKAPKGLAGSTVQRHIDRIGRQDIDAERLGHHVAEHRAHGTVRVDDVQGDLDGHAVAECFLRHGDQPLVKVLVQLVVLAGHVAQRHVVVELEPMQDGGSRSSPSAFQWLIASRVSRTSACPIASSRLRNPSSARISRTSSARNSKKLTTNSGLPLNRDRSSGVLRGNTNRAGVQVANTHHDAAGNNQRCSREAVFLATQQGSNDNVASSLELTVNLNHHTVTETVEHEGLLGLGEAKFPGHTRVLQRVQRRGAGTAVVT